MAASNPRPLGISVIAAVFALVIVAAFVLVLSTASALFLIFILLPLLLIAYGLYEGMNGVRIITIVFAALVTLYSVLLIESAIESSASNGAVPGNGLLFWYAIGVAVVVASLVLIYYLATKKNVKDFFAASTAKSRNKNLALSATVTAYTAVYVLGALFSLGCFGCSNNLSASVVIASQGYLARSPQLGQNGNLSFTFGQSIGVKIYNTEMACAATEMPSGLPNPASAMVYLAPNGTATSTFSHAPEQGNLSLSSGETIEVSGLKCFDSNSNALASPPIGTRFAGFLWINYTLDPGLPGASNPIATVKFATYSLKVT